MSDARALDLTASEGTTSVYLNGVTFAGFRGSEAPTLRLRNGTCATAEDCTFRNLTLLAGGGGTAGTARATAAAGSAVYAGNGSGVLLMDVRFEGNVVRGSPAGGRAVGLRDGARLFAAPETTAWQLPQGLPVPSEAITDIGGFDGRFLDAGAAFRDIQAEHALLAAEALAAGVPAEAPAEAGAPGPADGASTTDGTTATGTVSQAQTGETRPMAARGGSTRSDPPVNVGLLVGVAVSTAVAVGACTAAGIAAALRAQRMKFANVEPPRRVWGGAAGGPHAYEPAAADGADSSEIESPRSAGDRNMENGHE